MDIIKLVDKGSSNNSKYTSRAFQGLVLIHRGETKLRNDLSETLTELNFIYQEFQDRYKHILTNGTPELAHNLDDIRNIPPNKRLIIELTDIKLSTYFKTYLVFTKSCLDKLISLFQFRFYYDKKTFERRGKHLIKFFKENYQSENKNEIIKLIEKNKVDWIDNLLLLRDKFTHFSSLDEYRNFHLMMGKNNSLIEGIKDFQKPQIVVNNEVILAIRYLDYVTDKLVHFANDLLTLSGFNNYYSIPAKFRCDKCKYDLVKVLKNSLGNKTFRVEKDFSIEPLFEKYQHGVVTCPECSHQMEMNISRFSEVLKMRFDGHWKS